MTSCPEGVRKSSYRGPSPSLPSPSPSPPSPPVSLDFLSFDFFDFSLLLRLGLLSLPDDDLLDAFTNPTTTRRRRKRIAFIVGCVCLFGRGTKTMGTLLLLLLCVLGFSVRGITLVCATRTCDFFVHTPFPQQSQTEHVYPTWVSRASSQMDHIINLNSKRKTVLFSVVFECGRHNASFVPDASKAQYVLRPLSLWVLPFSSTECIHLVPTGLSVLQCVWTDCMFSCTHLCCVVL